MNQFLLSINNNLTNGFKSILDEYNYPNIFTYCQESVISQLHLLLHQSLMKHHCINIFSCNQSFAAMKINSSGTRVNYLTNHIILTFIVDEVPLHKFFHLPFTFFCFSLLVMITIDQRYKTKEFISFKYRYQI